MECTGCPRQQCVLPLAAAALVTTSAVAGVNRALGRVLTCKLPAALVLAPQSVPARAGPLILRSVVLRR